jgi:predicted  nucleic acid-binding Zn-ribbon protein
VLLKILHDEHAQVAAATRSVESNLLMRETELLHLQKDRKVILSDKEKLAREAKDLIADKQKLNSQLERAKDQIKSLSREIEECDALERARKDRSSMVENELRHARSLLVDASSTAAETETTSLALKEAVETFMQENASLHAKLEEIQDRSRAKEERLHEALVKTESNAQTLRIKATAHDEQINHLLSEKAGYEKQINQLKSRIANLDNRLKDNVVFMSPSPASRTTSGETSTEPKSRKIAFSVPSLTPVVTHKSTAASKAVTCCMCYKPPSGLMKSCQCGKPNCDKRAHSTCLGKTKGRSLSHPGSPSPCLPIVLCQHT